MQNETHFTQQRGRTISVYRKSDNTMVATMTRVHSGWRANMGAGITLVYKTQAQAFREVSARRP